MKYAFVLGMGRSGTKFLSGLLSLDASVYATHEFIGNREYWLMNWYLGMPYAKVKLEEEKIRIDREVNKPVFIDINSYLADSYEALQLVFDRPEIYHLVRDPRKVVPSIMTRRHEDALQKLPKTESEIRHWNQMSKLEQVCVNWVQVTEDLLKTDAQLLKFENIVNDYQYLTDNLLNHLNVSISKEDFDVFRTKKVNKTKGLWYRYLYAKYKGKKFVNTNYSFNDFNEVEQKRFYDICGNTMKKLNYL